MNSAPEAAAASGRTLEDASRPFHAEPELVDERATGRHRASEGMTCRPQAAAFAPPLVLVDPRPPALVFVHSLRARGTKLVVLSSRRLEPAFQARRVERHLLPPLAAAPERWQARLLELAARLEPRPLLWPCSRPALDLVREARAALEPHYGSCTGAEPLPGDVAAPGEPETTLRRAARCGEAVLEVQVVHDPAGRRTGACVLAWAPGAVPDLLVTSVEGRQVVARSDTWLRARGHIGYARLLWVPDRFGVLTLQSSSILPGPGLALALQDGVDLPALAYAAVTGIALPPQAARLQLTRRLSVIETGPADDAPLVELLPRLSWRDPLPWFSALARTLLRS